MSAVNSDTLPLEIARTLKATYKSHSACGTALLTIGEELDELFGISKAFVEDIAQKELALRNAVSGSSEFMELLEWLMDAYEKIPMWHALAIKLDYTLLLAKRRLLQSMIQKV